MSVLEGITLSIAVLGAALGLINTWHTLDRSRVKLRVRPKHAVPVGGASPDLRFCIEVTNLSAFPVTIEEAGLLHAGTKSRSAYAIPVLIDGGSWPRRLEPRSSVTVYGERPTALRGHPIRCAYARTACGVVRNGNSPALKQLAHEAAAKN